jgi:cellulose synthase/poly-beta-1,6-N-acetylglucosamine synthase-like glycosyltransferase
VHTLDVSVVIPAYNAERTLGRVLDSLSGQSPRPAEVIVVDDGSTDATAAVAGRPGVRVITTPGDGYAGGARNAGWRDARQSVVVFLDADVVPSPGWSVGLERALGEFPGAIVGCARTFAGRTRWGWVAHLQVETPYLARGSARDAPFVSSFCMAVPREVPIRWDESYGGEDALFCADAAAAGIRLVFDPRFHAFHDHERTSFRDLRNQQRRLAYGLARCGPVQREGLHKRVLARVPIHYFVLLRLPVIYRRLRGHEDLRRRFLRLLPLMVLAEWTLGLAALRYALKRPALRGQEGRGFRQSA